MKYRHKNLLAASLALLLVINCSIPVVAKQPPQRDRRVTDQSEQSATPTPAPTALSELQSRIFGILQRPELAPAIVGIKAVSLESGRVLVDHNAGKLLRPASNMKLYTVAAALDRLSPDFRFRTSVYAANRPDAAGVVRGDLTIYGRGDPSIAARFNDGDYFKGVNELASRIASVGVKRVEGDLVGDETFLTGPQYGSGWTWEDLQWWYGAEVSALSINDNALDLFIKPGLRVGASAVITTGPPDPLLTIVNRVATVPKGARRELSIHRGLGKDVIEVVGTMPIDDRGYSGAIGISHPALLFVYLLRSALAQRSVTITGRSRIIPAPATVAPSLGPPEARIKLTSAAYSSSVEIASLESPPLSVIAAQTLKPSQNLYTELVLRTLGQVAPPSTDSYHFRSSEEAGLEVVRSFLREARVEPQALTLTGGSGLSRNDMITADATVQLLIHMNRHRYANAFREALPIAGVDGTLRNRLKGTAAEGNVRAKTGTLSSAASLSGYMVTAAGEPLAFSIMVNNYPNGTDVRSLCIDPITVLLASFAGRS